MKDFTEESLRNAQTELPDEFSVPTENTMFNIEADILYCLLNAPNKEAVEKHHENKNKIMDYGNKNNCLNSLYFSIITT
jgi:hypothetical protein